MEDNNFKIQRIYYLLYGIYQNVKEHDARQIDISTQNNYNNLLTELSEIIEENLDDYYFHHGDNTYGFSFLNKISPIISYLKNMYIESSEYQIQKVGALYKSIEDKELKKRCEDILLGEDAFDRAINQATQVLEDRIKIKANLEKTNLIGLPLVNKAIHSKIEETILKISDEPSVQEGYSNLFKGIISTYRNPTHHSLTFICSRESALKTCAFIDELLKIVDNSQVIRSSK